jgi:hypothetical protein
MIIYGVWYDMIIYGVWYDGRNGEELQNLYMSEKDAQAYVESRRNPDNFFVTDMRVY